MGVALLIVALLACVACQAFFNASEIAVVSADEIKVKAETAQGAQDSRLLERLLAQRDRLLALILTSTNLATVTAAALLTGFLHSLGHHAEFLAPFILVPLTLGLGESLPKLLALRKPLEFVRFAARPLDVLSTLLAPILGAETWLSRQLRRMAGISPEVQSVFLTREDLTLLVHRRSTSPEPSHDEIQPSERQMISRIFRFSRSEARKVMVPLVRVEAVARDQTVAEAIEVVRREGFSRLPVFDERITNLIGLVHIFDLFDAPDLERPVAEVMRPVSYFAESTPLDEILLALQRSHQSLAVIVDEYGGAAGIITIEDLLEEVVGEIEDEYDVREELARVVNPRTLVVAGRAPLAELNERFGLRLPEEDGYATIGGLVVERLGHIPKLGEQFKVHDVTITVARSDARAVREVVLRLGHPMRPEQMRRR